MVAGRIALKFIDIVIFLCLLPSLAVAQSLVLRGRVTDESKAVVPGANVVLNGPSGLVRTTKSGPEGTYVFSGLAAGDYTVQASTPQLILREPAAVSVRNASQTL